MDETEATPTDGGFAVSIVLLHRLGFAHAASVRKLHRTVTVPPGFRFSVRVFAFRRPADARLMRAKLDAAMARIGLAPAVMNATVDDRHMPLYVSHKADVSEVVRDPELWAQTPDGFRTTVATDAVLLEMLSKFTGYRVQHHPIGTLSEPPVRTEPGTLVYHAWARPPGLRAEGHTVMVKEIGGLPAWRDGETRYVVAPTLGRGRLVPLGAVNVLQVLGHNYYQLAVTSSDHHDPAVRALLVAHIVCAIVKDLEEHPEPTSFEAEGSSGRGAFTEFADELAGAQLKRLCQKLETLGADIVKLQNELAEKLLKQRELSVTANVLRESSMQEDLRRRLPGELERLKGIEGVTRVQVVDGGVHLTMEHLTLEHEGARYPMGVFTIRLDPVLGRVEAWTDAPLHPKGHHHPHVAARELSCYGNVGLALIKAMAAYRLYDAAVIAVRWLHAYSPETTLYPIHEWPREKSEEVRHVV